MTGDHPTVVGLWLAPPGTPLPVNVVGPLHVEFVNTPPTRWYHQPALEPIGASA